GVYGGHGTRFNMPRAKSRDVLKRVPCSLSTHECVTHQMILKHLLAMAAIALAVSADVTATAGQQPQPLPVQDRLNRVRSDFFSPTPPVTDDVRELKAILGVDPQTVEAHLLLGMAYRAQGTQEMLAEAVAEFRQALEIKPDFTPAHFYLAHVYLDLGRP